MIVIDELTKAWAAGIFDGEGSALIERTGEHSYQICVAVATTDSKISKPIMTCWGGHHRKTRDLNKWGKEGHSVFKIDYSVYFSEKEAYRFLIDILPYVRTKQDDILIVLRAILALPPVQEDTGRRARGSLKVLEPFYDELWSVRPRGKGWRQKPLCSTATSQIKDILRRS